MASVGHAFVLLRHRLAFVPRSPRRSAFYRTAPCEQCDRRFNILTKKSKTKYTVYCTRIGAWNVRTLMDNAGSDRPQRRTALVGRELGRYDIQIAALSETRFADVGEIKEVGAGYTFFWSGRKS